MLDEYKYDCGHCGDVTDRGKLKNWETDLSHCHLVHHKFHMNWIAIEAGPPQ
jgi:hypothetical protein